MPFMAYVMGAIFVVIMTLGIVAGCLAAVGDNDSRAHRAERERRRRAREIKQWRREDRGW